MLTERKLIDPEKTLEIIKAVTSTETNDNIYKINLDFVEPYSKSNIFYVFLFQQKITSLSKSSTVSDFLNNVNYKGHPKLIVAKNNTSMKIVYNIKNDLNNPHTEIFLEKELMLDWAEHISVPRHILLTDDELKNVIAAYHAKRREIPQIYVTDSASRYYNARIGDMFRIVRSSETTGLSPYYRLVVKGDVIKT